MKKPLDIFVEALKTGLQLCKVVKEVLNTANEIATGTEQALLDMTKEAADIAREEASRFQEALRAAKASGEALMVRYKKFEGELEQFQRFVGKLTGVKVISMDDFAKGRQILQFIVLHAKNCFDNYPVYMEKLRKAIDVGTQLAARCEVESQKATNVATNTRTAGYSATCGLGVIAVGFLFLATGVVAGLGAAVFGLGTLRARVATKNRAKEMDSVADKIRKLQDQLDHDVSELNRCADKIEGRQEMTRQMVEELEIQMKLVVLEQKAAATNYAS